MQDIDTLIELQRVAPVEALIREPLRHLITGISGTTWWRLEHAGRAPRRVKITGDICGWRLSELQQWVQERVERGPIPLDDYYQDKRRPRLK
jgi:prophage regulatory protein